MTAKNAISDTGFTVLHNPESAIADIVFVHGLQGHPWKTWACKAAPDTGLTEAGSRSSSPGRIRQLFSRKQKSDSGHTGKAGVKEVYWPRDLLPGDCADARILTWGFDSRVSHFFNGPANQSNVSAYARDLLYALEKKRLHCPKRSLIFVAHSLGGIIVKDVICRAATESNGPLLDIYRCTTAILFLGTPHRGSSIAETGEILRKIVSVSGFSTSDRNVQALHLDSSELEGIHERFMKLKQSGQWHAEIRTFQEAKGMTGFNYFKLGEKVVNDFSSSLDGAERRQTINGNHMNMCRYASKHDDGYQKVAGELQIFLTRIQERLLAEEELDKNKTTTISRVESPSQATTASSIYSLNDIERLCITLFNTSEITEYKAVLPSRVEGTCRWVLTNPQYQYWMSEIKPCLLWISGPPGSGKTILSAYLLDYLNANNSAQNAGITVCFFFCDDKIETQRDAKSILRSIIFQILTRRRKLVRYIKSAYDLQGAHLVENFSELWRIFKVIVSDKRVGPINVIVDAIDECEEITRNRFIEEIVALVGRPQSAETSSSPHVKFLFTSRPLLGRQYTTNHLHIEDVHGNIENDLRLVIQDKIDGIARRTNCKPETRMYLERALHSKADQTFLWVTFVLRVLEKSPLGSQKDFQRIVDDLPQGLAAVYERFLFSIPTGYQELARKLLHFIVGSLTPLTLDEMRILLAVEDHHRSLAEVEEDAQPNIRKTVEGILGPLVRILDSKVDFIHLSVKDYLTSLSSRAEDPLSAIYGVELEKANLLLSKACVTYLQLTDFAKDLFSADQSGESPTSLTTQSPDSDHIGIYSDPFAIGEDVFLMDPADLESDTCKAIAERYPFFDYAARHWARHFSSSGKLCSESLQTSVIALSESSNNRNSTYFRYYWLHAGVGLSYPTDFGAFITTCFFGHISSLIVLLDDATTVDQDVAGRGVYWAARMGHGEIVNHLLQRRVPPDSIFADGQTALVAAAQFDHVAVVEILLHQAETDVNFESRGGRTPISVAAGNGHMSIVGRLLKHDRIQPDLPDFDQWTPLFWAIGGKYLNIVRMLASDERVSVTHVDKQGRSVLSWAAAAGEVDIVKYLLTHKELDVQCRDVKGRGAFSYAAENGHLDTISLLRRSKRIDISAERDDKGRNAISWACAGGHHRVVEYLLKHDPAGADAADLDDWTPLAWALNRYDPKTVEMLLASGLADVNRRDFHGRATLAWAAVYGYTEVVRLLLRVKGVDVNAKENSGATALSLARVYKRADIVDILQNRSG